MTKDYYTDAVLGDWKLLKKDKEYLTYERSREVTVHRSVALKNFDAEKLKEFHVWGKVILRQQKKICIANSKESLFKFIDYTSETQTEEVVK